MKHVRPFLLTVILLCCSNFIYAQAWTGILDPSRATTWTGNVGFTIPNYTVACPTQPSLSTGSSNAAANTTAINAAIQSCTSTQNVVNLPSGTYYVAGFTWGQTGTSPGKSNAVVRGAGPNSTYLYDTAPSSGCSGFSAVGFCMTGDGTYQGSSAVQPGGAHACSWTAGYSQGTTTVTLDSCGGTPPGVGNIIILDQADDTTDTGGIFLCSTYDTSDNCTQKGEVAENPDGRVISGTLYSEQQIDVIASIAGSGSGPYTVGLQVPIYFNNIRSSQSPGAWWGTNNITYDGLENLTLDHSTDTSTGQGGMILWCVYCWVRNVRMIDCKQNCVQATTDFAPVIRDSYFYESQSYSVDSYTIQMGEVSAALVENNIFQYTMSPDIKDAVTGSVSAYNFTPKIASPNYMQGMYASHNAGSAFNLLEGNATTDFIADDIWGTSDLITIFRNQSVGWQPAADNPNGTAYVNTIGGLDFLSGVRAMNAIGNVFGEPGYHTQYEAYATSTTGGSYVTTHGGTPQTCSTNCQNLSTSIYSLGWSDTGCLGCCATPPTCDSLTYSTLMRWGNYDVVDGAVIWDSTEGSPAAVPYVNANSPTTETLPASFYLSSRPSWFRDVPFPPYGPDVTSGTTGICTSGTYSGIWATSSSQCSGGSFTASAWGGHANANPAQDCYLNVMGGPPDGSGSVLAFDADTCYSSGGTPSPAPPTNLSAVAH